MRASPSVLLRTFLVVGACLCAGTTYSRDVFDDLRDLTDHVHPVFGTMLIAETLIIVMLVVRMLRRRHALLVAEERNSADMTHATRLALAGEISASIVHEVTQPLSAMQVNIESAELALARREPDIAMAREILSDIKRDQQRAIETVHRLRSLLRNRKLQFEQTDLNALVANVLTLIRADLVRNGVVVHTAFDTESSPVTADPVYVQQVLINLFVNALEAMSDTPVPSRLLEVSTHRDRDRVEVTVSDNGRGMTRDQIDKIFDLFFTTKQGGMGVGLSISRSIVQAHSGAIWAERRAAGGTDFHFTLPLLPAQREMH